VYKTWKKGSRMMKLIGYIELIGKDGKTKGNKNKERKSERNLYLFTGL
jgi:hypothetical protein